MEPNLNPTLHWLQKNQTAQTPLTAQELADTEPPTENKETFAKEFRKLAHNQFKTASITAYTVTKDT